MEVGDKVRGLVSGYIEELEGKAGKRASKPVTFSMRLSEQDHARLVWLARNLGVPKTPLAEELLKAAVDEAIEQYAGWASPGNPEAVIGEAGAAEVEGRAARERPGPPGGPPPHRKPRKPGPKHPK